MTRKSLILSIDQGTTSTRAILFEATGRPLRSASKEHMQIYPENGWVEHDPEEIWQATLQVCREVIEGDVDAIAALGITNQRETTVIWERASGKPVYNAIVWQDRRTADFCAELKSEGFERELQARTGLLADPYFSGTKVRWLLDQVDGARERAGRGELCFGTIDSWLVWKLTGGARHVTDATNAARTLLYNIGDNSWDDVILNRFGVPSEMLPDVLDCAADFGSCDPSLFGGAIPIAGIAGDQQAATVGQACFERGMTKSTYGTGCFALVNTGEEFVPSTNRLLSTIAYRIGGKTTYALEGSIFMAGATIQWVRDGLGLIRSAAESEEMAREARDGSGVYMVPAFTGLGAPYWDPHARGAILGMTRDTDARDIVRAAIESVSFQTRDLMEAIGSDMAAQSLDKPERVRVDGGMVANNWFVQNLADTLAMTVDRPVVTETTALGAAYLAGLGAGLYPGLEAVTEQWQCERVFEPRSTPGEREKRYAGWQEAVRRILST